ncbi:phospholipase A [Sphingosinicella sp.]|uniref:phospholipase A n=1 Tax=Sphingosinicella sp. TaxID=1917971 RepID=UPI00261E941C|nr:phospholipase A [Sphingosinicella sp.]
MRPAALVAALIVTSPAAAEVRLVVPEAAAPRTGTFEVVFLNDGAAAAKLDAPRTITVAEGEATLEGVAPAEIAPGGFARVSYRLADAVAAQPQVGAAVSTATPQEAEATSLGRFETYQPMYALVGANPSDAKLQLSFRYRLFGQKPREFSTGDGSREWRAGLYFGYTQRMFWDLSQESIPMYDITFSPELFVRAVSPGSTSVGSPMLGIQAGVRHQSNGEDGADSRSFNTLYVEPSVGFGLGNGWTLTAAPRIWAYVGSKEGNERIARYRGYTGLTLDLKQTDGLGIRADIQGNIEGGRGSAEVDVSYSLRQWTGLNLYLYSQLYTGYGEALIDYDERSTRLRFGIGIVR